MLSTIHSFQSVVALRDSIVKNICLYTKKHKTAARTPLLCAFNIYCFIKLIHNSSDFSRINHVAMYIGGGMVIHASNERDGIKISNAYYRSPIKIGRVIND